MKHANLRVEFRCVSCGKLQQWTQEYQGFVDNKDGGRFVRCLCKSCFNQKVIKIVKA